MSTRQLSWPFIAPIPVDRIIAEHDSGMWMGRHTVTAHFLLLTTIQLAFAANSKRTCPQPIFLQSQIC